MTAEKWQAKWQAGMEKNQSGISPCEQVLLIADLKEAWEYLQQGNRKFSALLQEIDGLRAFKESVSREGKFSL